MRLFKKRLIIPIIMLVIIFVIFLVTPKFLSFLKSESRSAIDYTVNALLENENTNEKTKETLNETKNNIIKDDFSERVVDINLGSESVSLNTNYTNEVYEIDTLYADAPIQLEIKNTTEDFEDDLKVSINKEEIPSGGSFKIDAINNKEHIEIELQYKEFRRNYYIQTVPSDFPSIQKYKVSMYDGEYYSDFYLPESTYIYKMSNEGELLYYKRKDGNRSLTNFTKWELDDKIRYSYFQENNYNKVAINSYSFGDFVVLNENYEEIDRVHSLQTNKVEGNTTEAHDFVLVDDGHYYVMDYVIDNPNKNDVEGIELNNKVVAGYVQEIKNKEVIWEWISTDYPDFYNDSKEGNDFSNEDIYAADYIHMNSFFVDPKDGNIIMNMRNLDAVIKVDKSTNDILWTLGGNGDDFELSKSQSPSRQHHATVTEAGNLIIFDNGTINKQTRILEFKLDEDNKTVEEYKEFQVADVFSQFTGSVQKIDEENDVFLIGWGMNRTQPAMMSEIDFKNDKVLTEIVEPEMEVHSYRFMKFE